MYSGNYVCGNYGDTPPEHEEVEIEIEKPQKSDFYFVDKMEAFWDNINHDLLEQILNP